MAPYFGLRGPSLNRAIMWLVVCPAFVTYGYNQGVMGGLLTLESFAETFPQMNTLTATDAEEKYNSTIQGKPHHYTRGTDRSQDLGTSPLGQFLMLYTCRHGSRTIYRWWNFWFTIMHSIR